MAKALLFNFTGDRKKKLHFLLMQFGISEIEGTREDCSRPLGRILGKNGLFPGKTMDAPFLDELLVMDDLSSQQLHGLLNGLQMLQVQVPYKAITTEHNLQWTPSRLYKELVAEHEAMNRR